jgi:hypothetical protein
LKITLSVWNLLGNGRGNGPHSQSSRSCLFLISAELRDFWSTLVRFLCDSIKVKGDSRNRGLNIVRAVNGYIVLILYSTWDHVSFNRFLIVSEKGWL